MLVLTGAFVDPPTLRILIQKSSDMSLSCPWPESIDFLKDSNLKVFRSELALRVLIEQSSALSFQDK